MGPRTWPGASGDPHARGPGPPAACASPVPAPVTPVGAPRNGRRALLLGAVGLATATGACSSGNGAVATPSARPIAMDAPAGTRLEPLGGLLLDEAATGFHGLSGLWLDEDLSLLAISDLGRWMTARVAWEQGRPTGLDLVRTGPLRDGAGQPLARGHAGDAEALARTPDGTWLVGFERWHRIRAYRDIDGPGRYLEVPRGLSRAPANGGLEAVAVLADRRWLLIAEKLGIEGEAGVRKAWLGYPAQWMPVAYRPAPGMDPVDAVALPDGGALVLERGFSLLGGFSGRLVRIPPAAITDARAAAVLAGEEILRLGWPLPSDNFEAVSLARVGGRDILVLGSDDNESTLQRTYLLFFALPNGGE